LGCAYLAGLDSMQRDKLLQTLQQAHPHEWPQMKMAVQKALKMFRAKGYCCAQWQAGMGAAAAPIHSPSGRTYAINISFPVGAEDTENDLLQEFAPLLLELVAQIQQCWSPLKAP